MGKVNWTSVLVAGIVIIGTLAGMSLAIRPSTVDAGDILGEHECEETGEITMIGSAEIESEPDLIVIYLKIQARDKDSAVAAKDKVAEIIDKVLKGLKELGLEDDDIETTGYNIQPEYEWINNRRVFKRYLVTCNMKVTVKDFDKAGNVIDASVDNGALVNSINFELSKEKQEELKTLVMAEAAKDAKGKAEAVISALGQKLGKVKSVNLNYGYQPYLYWSYDAVVSLEGGAKNTPPTTIMPKDLTVSAKLSVVFGIL